MCHINPTTRHLCIADVCVCYNHPTTRRLCIAESDGGDSTLVPFKLLQRERRRPHTDGTGERRHPIKPKSVPSDVESNKNTIKLARPELDLN